MADKITEGDIIEVRYLDMYEESDWTPLSLIRLKQCPAGKVQGTLLSEDEDCMRILKMIIVNGAIEASYVLIPKKPIITSVRRIEEAEIDDFGRE
jgi:hypothetical protein